MRRRLSRLRLTDRGLRGACAGLGAAGLIAGGLLAGIDGDQVSLLIGGGALLALAVVFPDKITAKRGDTTFEIERTRDLVSFVRSVSTSDEATPSLRAKAAELERSSEELLLDLGIPPRRKEHKIETLADGRLVITWRPDELPAGLVACELFEDQWASVPAPCWVYYEYLDVPTEQPLFKAVFPDDFIRSQQLAAGAMPSWPDLTPLHDGVEPRPGSYELLLLTMDGPSSSSTRVVERIEWAGLTK